MTKEEFFDEVKCEEMPSCESCKPLSESEKYVNALKEEYDSNFTKINTLISLIADLDWKVKILGVESTRELHDVYKSQLFAEMKRVLSVYNY